MSKIQQVLVGLRNIYLEIHSYQSMKYDHMQYDHMQYDHKQYDHMQLCFAFTGASWI